MKTIFAILKQLSARETDIVGEGVVEVLPRRLRLSALVGSELPAGNVARRGGRSHHGDAPGAANRWGGWPPDGIEVPRWWSSKITSNGSHPWAILRRLVLISQRTFSRFMRLTRQATL